jgi:hypothetical protein
MAEPSHPRPPRRQPLTAAARPEAPEEAPPARRPLRVAVAIGAAIGLAVASLTYSVIVLPLYLLAELDADGLDRPLVRDAFFGIAVPVGLLVGLVAGVVVGVALARGGRLPTDRTSFHER